MQFSSTSPCFSVVLYSVYFFVVVMSFILLVSSNTKIPFMIDLFANVWHNFFSFHLIFLCLKLQELSHSFYIILLILLYRCFFLLLWKSLVYFFSKRLECQTHCLIVNCGGIYEQQALSNKQKNVTSDM